MSPQATQGVAYPDAVMPGALFRPIVVSTVKPQHLPDCRLIRRAARLDRAYGGADFVGLFKALATEQAWALCTGTALAAGLA